MRLANYQIELPISSDFPCQLLYKGFDDNKQSYFINLFPKASINQEMYEQITNRVQNYTYIQDILEDDNHILISYLNSSNWQKISPKFTNSEFDQYVKELYRLYSLDQFGYYDFDKEHIYIHNKNIFILDYGLRFLQCKQKLKEEKNIEYNQTSLMKTWIFGSLIYCLSTGARDSGFLIKLNQNQIDYQVEYNCRQNNISENNITLIKMLLRLDHNTRPAFDQLLNLPIFKQNNAAMFKSMINLKKEENGQQKVIKMIDNTSDMFSKSAPQFKVKSYLRENQSNTVHHSKIKSALKQHYIQSIKPIKDSKLNSFKLASQIVKSKLQKSTNFSQRFNQTTTSHYQNIESMDNKSLNFQSKSQYQNLSINIDTVNKNKKFLQNNAQNSNAVNQTNQIQIKPKSEQTKQKPQKSQINSFDFPLFDEDNEDEEFQG